MVTEMEAFLRAEESANELLSSLEQLKDEIEGYARAKGSLEDVRSQLVSLAQTLGRTAEQSTSVIAALERIGTPEILKEIENVVVLNDKSVEAFERLRKEVSETIPSMESKIGTALSENSEFLKASNTMTQNHISEQVGILKQQIDSRSKSLSNDFSKMTETAQKQGKAIKLMIGIGLPLVAAVIAVVLFLVKNY